MNTQPSTVRVSNELQTIVQMHKDICDTLLVGEKVAMIQEAAYVYNELRDLITPDYLMDDELAFLSSVGKEWTEEVERYNATMRGAEGITDAHRDNMDDIENDIRKALEEFINGIDGIGDGSDDIGV